MSDGGKGSAPRKQQDQKAYADNWEAIFGRKKREEALQEMVRISEELGLYDEVKNEKLPTRKNPC